MEGTIWVIRECHQGWNNLLDILAGMFLVIT